MTEGVSINKYIAETGFCSRREADEYIAQARVKINHQIAEKGNRVMDGDIIHIDDELFKKQKKNYNYIICNKPKGITCTTDTKDKTNIIAYINYKTRIFPIGRLDKLSEGLILLTDDGDIVNKILRAGNNHEKEYIVTVDKILQLEHIQKMRNGMRILGTTTKKCFVQTINPTTFKIILTQGLNRQIRRMCEQLGYKVTSLKRTRIMHITIKGLERGAWRLFTTSELDVLMNSLKVSRNAIELTADSMDE